MELRFRGQTYKSSSTYIDMKETNETRNFLGRQYTLRRPVARSFKPQCSVKIYRGVMYST